MKRRVLTSRFRTQFFDDGRHIVSVGVGVGNGEFVREGDGDVVRCTKTQSIGASDICGLKMTFERGNYGIVDEIDETR